MQYTYRKVLIIETLLLSIEETKREEDVFLSSIYNKSIFIVALKFHLLHAAIAGHLR